jgi:hypothetical protein
MRSDLPPVPEYIVRPANSPINIDGDLSDPAWSQAEVAHLVFPWPQQWGEHQETKVRLLWDKENLYVAFDVADTDITAVHQHRDDPTYKDDAVELFLNPFPDRNEYVGLEINACAVLYDYLYVYPHKLYANYDLKGVRLAGRREGTLNVSTDRDKGWTIELAIPLVNLVNESDHAPVQDGTVWTMNLARWDGVEPQRVLSLWSDSGASRPTPHVPQRFGRMVFSSK